MKRILISFCVSYLLVLSVKGQGVNFVFNNLDKATIEAKVSDKLIFLDLYADWCGPCKAMENTVFTKAEVGNAFNEHFINLKVDTRSEEGQKLLKKYSIREFPSYLFLNQKGEIVSKIIGFHSSNKLLSEVSKAKRAFVDFVPITNLDEVYKNETATPEFLYKYLKRKSYEEGAQPAILDKYLDMVPESEFQTEKVLSLISDNVALVSSKGFHVLSESLSRFMTMTESQQKSILRGISNSKKFTFKEAVEHKDDELFDVLIDAVHATSYSIEAGYAEERQFRYDYAKLTKNFDNFKLIAEAEAAQIMSKSPEDLDKQVEHTIIEFKKVAVERGISESSERFKSVLAGLENGAAKAASFQLNDFARGYYEMASEDSDYKNAINWSAYAVKLDPTPANWETYVFLLKKSGRNGEARKAMKKALKVVEKRNIDTESFKKAFKEIK